MVRQQDGWQAKEHRSGAWTALAWFWAAVLGCLVVAAVVLQVLGPPPRPQVAVAVPATPPPAAPRPVIAPSPSPAAPSVPAAPTAAPDAHPPQAVASAPAPPVVPAAGGVAILAPIAALQEPSAEVPGAMLPRIGPGGQMPMQVYAAAFDAADPRPRVAVLLAGIGMAEVDSDDAIRATPAAISLAISPYAPRPDRLLGLARGTGHETLVSIPMEPLGYPMNDAGNESLLTGLAPAQNHERLVWALSRIAGYVGATPAMSGLMGERFAASEQMPPVLEELAARGLLYVDPRQVPVRPGGPPSARPGVRVADLLIDDPPVRSEIEAKLSRLEQVARDRGNALGIAGLPGPVTVERLAAWAATLASRGIVLVPVSALVPPPSPPVPAAPAKPPP
jgi:polysaccharide deacetylase 2 family uncharacterized protein YibQ